jgi:hypothetical protein
MRLCEHLVSYHEYCAKCERRETRRAEQRRQRTQHIPSNVPSAHNENTKEINHLDTVIKS